jgi:hypothetical protein
MLLQLLAYIRKNGRKIFYFRLVNILLQNTIYKEVNANKLIC